MESVDVTNIPQQNKNIHQLSVSLHRHFASIVLKKYI